jgi:hypothetical protein
MTPDVDRFLARFTRFGAEPSVEHYLDLFHRDATLFDSGMERPLVVAEIPAHIEAILKLVPAFRMTPLRFRFREPTIFIEAHNQATLAGAAIEWPSIYCIDLRGERVIRGRRYYDRRPLLARISPALASAPAIAERVDGATGALPAEPPVAESIRRIVAGARFRLASEAGDATLCFREWEMDGSIGGTPLRIGIATRFELAAGAPTNARSYFDTTPLVAAAL